MYKSFTVGQNTIRIEPVERETFRGSHPQEMSDTVEALSEASFTDAKCFRNVGVCVKAVNAV
jgi:hypothetical protein